MNGENELNPTTGTITVDSMEVDTTTNDNNSSTTESGGVSNLQNWTCGDDGNPAQNLELRNHQNPGAGCSNSPDAAPRQETKAQSKEPAEMDMQKSYSEWSESQQRTLPKGYKHIWSGEINWRGVQGITGKSECLVVTNNEVQIKGCEDWPLNLHLSLIPKKVLSGGFGYLDNSKELFFKFQKCSDTMVLTKFLKSDFVGHVNFAGNGQTLTKSLIVIYSKEQRIFVGLIPDDQTGFNDGLRRLILHHKSLATHPKPLQKGWTGNPATSGGWSFSAPASQNLALPLHRIPQRQEGSTHSLNANLPTPPNWESCFLEAQNQEVMCTFTRFPVSPSSQEYQVIADMLVPLTLSLSSMDRVVNPGLWNKFISKRTELIANKSVDWALLAELGVPPQTIERKSNAHSSFECKPNLGPYADNVVLLWHGTKNLGGIDAILSEGLDERLSGTGFLGRGIYFTDDPIKASAYDANGTLMLFAVMLGDCLAANRSEHNNIHRVREPQKMSAQKRTLQDEYFDSIVGRPTDRANEFVIYNRAQCCPLYAVKFRMRSVINQSMSFACNVVSSSSRSRSMIPNFAWVSPEHQQNKGDVSDGIKFDYAFHVQTVFGMMKQCNLMGNLGNPEVAQFISDIGEGNLNVNSNPALVNEFDVEMSGWGRIVSATSKYRHRIFCLCGICLKEYPYFNQEQWKILSCSHKLCTSCVERLRTTATTMSGKLHTFIKCPYCKSCSGVEIGSCPDGTMYIRDVSEVLEGYEGYGTFLIEYRVLQGVHRESRLCYLPNNTEGQVVLRLLCEAWDRRLILSIGTSATRGESNILVWNIHHKTKMVGGAENYGYPDPTYLNRVKEELAQYGIK